MLDCIANFTGVCLHYRIVIKFIAVNMAIVAENFVTYVQAICNLTVYYLVAF